METLSEREQEFRRLGLADGLSQTLFKKNRQQFIRMFKEALGDKQAANSLAFFKGASEVPLYSSDVSYPEYQEAFFYYLFGVSEMDCYGVIDLEREKTILFMPKLDNYYKIWMTLLTTDEYKKKYHLIDEIHFTDALPDFFKNFQPSTVYLNLGVNSDSGLTTMTPEDKFFKETCPDVKVDTTLLHNVLCESRVIKNDEEIDIMRWASKITGEAHQNVMRNVKAGQRESQLESFFRYDCEQKYFCGRVQPYHSICGCGPTAATLHYHDNNKWLVDGQMMLTDQGHQVHHYVSDVTTSFPVNGKFTQKQKDIYNIVLKANRTVMNAMKPGVIYKDMHLLSERITLEGLKELGLVEGDVSEMLEKRLGFIFQPHGLGHLIGLDVHDVGGYLEDITPKRDERPGLKNLRTAREMKAGMCMTIEPGCYFRDFLLQGELDKDKLNIDLKYINLEKVREYQKEVSGVRIEDVVLITETGCELLSDNVPRTVEQIEACMKGEDWAKLPNP
uniref:Aminopeptidase P N-terminal domain-containing protein n=1 Tax=Strombidium rassoulzadegani TaxID=1082188 RepID=A0A7S3CMP7_9SPIT